MDNTIVTFTARSGRKTSLSNIYLNSVASFSFTYCYEYLQFCGESINKNLVHIILLRELYECAN